MNLLRIMGFLTLFFSLSSFAFDLSFEPNSNLPLVDLNIAFKVGSSADPDTKLGLTRFLGHMLLRGTTAHSKKQIDQSLDQMGAKLEVEVRAEALILRGSVLSDQLTPFLKLLTELITQSTFPKSEMDRLKNETLALIREELGHDSELGNRAFNAFLFQGHPYGKPMLGRTQHVQSFTQADLKAHKNRIFRDQALVVVGSGDTALTTITQWVKTLAYSLPKEKLSTHDLQMIAVAATPKNKSQFRIQIVDKPERTQTQIFGGQIGLRMNHPDFFPLHIGNYAFGGHSFSATLMVEIREKRGWSYGAYSYFREGRQPRSWTFHLFPAEKDTTAALSYTLELIRELKEQGLTTQRFNFAKNSLIANAGFLYSTPKKRIENILLEKTMELPNGIMQSYAEHLEKVTLEQTNQALRRFLEPEHMAVTIVGTAAKLREPLTKTLHIDASQIEIKAYTVE